MQINEAHSLLEAWQIRMAPSPAPFKGQDRVKDEWVKRLELASQEQARAAWRSWQNAGHTKWPNLYQLEALLQRHGGISELNGCTNCDDTGWLEAPEYQHHGHTYTACQPCSCDHGKMVERSTIWRDRPMLCTGCNGNGWLAGHDPTDDVELCAMCNGDGIRR